MAHGVRAGGAPPAAPGAVASRGGAQGILAPEEIRSFVEAELGPLVEGKRVCVVVPDATRACPLPLLVSAVGAALAGGARHCVLVALGTHPPMGEAALAAHLGGAPEAPPGGLAHAVVLHHARWDPASPATVGEIPESRIRARSGGLLARPVPVRVNRAVLEHDVALLVGPVLPHEVVGFSGGNKYLFPGVSGPEVVDVSHWLGALLTSAAIIGTTGQTPVRALIDEAAAMVPVERLALCAVTRPGGEDLHALRLGEPVAAWASAAEVAAATHVRHLPGPVRRVLSIVPARYGDL